MKKLLAVFLAMLFVLSMAPFALADDVIEPLRPPFASDYLEGHWQC